MRTTIFHPFKSLRVLLVSSNPPNLNFPIMIAFTPEAKEPMWEFYQTTM